MFSVGVDGLTSFITVEPYSSKVKGRQGNSAEDSVGEGSGTGGKGKNKPHKPFSEMSVEERVRMCCTNWNSAKGCDKSAGKCRYKHWCTAIEASTNRVCWSRDHNMKSHK